MITSEYHSTVVLPKIEKPYPSILEFLKTRFPGIETKIWEARINSAKGSHGSG